MNRVKDQIIDFAKNMPVDQNWSGPLTPNTVRGIAARIRLMFDGKVFAIASALYADSCQPELNLVTNVTFQSNWTDGNTDQVRVFEREDDNGCPSPWLGWTADASFWSFHSNLAPEDGHGNYTVPHFQFSEKDMKITLRTPVGQGCLHKYVYKVQ